MELISSQIVQDYALHTLASINQEREKTFKLIILSLYIYMYLYIFFNIISKNIRILALKSSGKVSERDCAQYAALSRFSLSIVP